MQIKKILYTEASAPNIQKTLNMQNTTNNSMFVPTANPMNATTENIKSVTSTISLWMTMFVFVCAGMFVSMNSRAQFSVTTNSGSGLAATYTSLADAITALIAATISGPVAITCPTGAESAPAGGYNITATGTSVTTITIQGNVKAVTVITAPINHSAGSFSDAVIKTKGGDYITISDFRLQESANATFAAVSNNMTEFGIALFNASATDGAQNNSISLGTT